MIERWKAIPRFEGLYEVSDQGRVRGIDRLLANGRSWKGRILSQKTGLQGHKSVRLCSFAGKHEWHGIHRLVLAAFVGPCPSGHQGAHNNGDATDNRLENLRWDTPVGNHSDKRKHGTVRNGSRNNRSKLSESDVFKIRSMRRKGIKLALIANHFGITAANVSSIANRKTWGHLEDAE